MAKGQPIGAPVVPRRRGGMLPPVKSGPVEVTREYIDQQESAGKEAGEKEQQELEVKSTDLPAADAPKPDIVAAASRIIYEAVVRFENGQRGLTKQLLQEAGPAVRLVHETGSFKEEIDQSTGRPYRSFRKWAADNGLSKSHAYRMINEVPVAEALTGVYEGAIPAGHLDVLAPALRQHGEEVLRKLWKTAEAGAQSTRDGGRPTVPELVRARQVMGLSVDPESDEPPVGPDVAKSFRAVQDALRVLADTQGALKLAMQHDPEAVQQLIREVFGTAGLELEGPGS